MKQCGLIYESNAVMEIHTYEGYVLVGVEYAEAMMFSFQFWNFV
jgi:hypothetical protein